MSIASSSADVSWMDAAWFSSLAIAFVATAVGITFFVCLILASMSLARIKVVRRLIANFLIGFACSFLNLFLLFGAVFAFPAVVINTMFVTLIYSADLYNGFRGHTGSWGQTAQRYFANLIVAIFSTVLGACLVKYTPGVLHKPGEVPPFDWEKDFQTWEGLGGWIFVNVTFGCLSLIFGSAAETWFYATDVRESQKKNQ